MGVKREKVGRAKILERMFSMAKPLSIGHLWPDLEAILLVELPASLRLALFLLGLLTAHALGLAWYGVAVYEREAVRWEVQGELAVLQANQTHLWRAYEATRTRQDRRELAEWVDLRPRPIKR